MQKDKLKLGLLKAKIEEAQSGQGNSVDQSYTCTHSLKVSAAKGEESWKRGLDGLCCDLGFALGRLEGRGLAVQIAFQAKLIKQT